MGSKNTPRLARAAAAASAVLLAATLVQIVEPGVAGAAGEPSVPLPAISSTSVSAQGMGPTSRDDASDRALRGDQTAGSAQEGSGNTAATPLSPSATWDVSAHTGDFAWSYPLRVPPAPGGLVPNLTLSYRSSEVDGRTSATNNQPSWIGDGWALSPGFIERWYGSCAEDTEGNVKPPQVGDLCWRSDNAVAAYSGGGGMLICCDGDKRWRTKVDDGSRIERRGGAGNGDNDGEWWKITTVDGTQYWFGSQPDSQSTWSETLGCTRDPATNALAGPASYRHSYTYDNAGNRRTETQHAVAGNTTRTYAYGMPGHVHALGSVTTTGPAVNTREDFTYEPTGQTRTRTRASGTQQFTWDAEGRLATATENGKTSSFVYDANGVRLIRRDANATTLYLGKQELRLKHAGGNPTVTRYYTHGGQVVAMRQGRGALTWLAGDHQATTSIAINSETKAVTQRRQLLFGAPRGNLVTFPGERGFVGGTIDAGTGLTHLGAREYDPTTGRFVSVDPIINPSEPHQLNGYTYANNNPVSFSDPTGLYCDSCDFYARRDGYTSVWRQEKGSRATTVKKPTPPKPASTSWGCETWPDTEAMLCDYKPDQKRRK